MMAMAEVMATDWVVHMQRHTGPVTIEHLDGVPLADRSGVGRTLDQNQISGILKNQ